MVKVVATPSSRFSQLGCWLERFFFEKIRNIPLPVFLLRSLSLLPPLFTLLPLIVDWASLSLELSADMRDIDDDVSCCNESGRVFVASKRVLPQPVIENGIEIEIEKENWWIEIRIED